MIGITVCLEAKQDVTTPTSIVPTGWSVMQRKVSGGSVSFNQTWAVYCNGFGSATGNDNFWLGLHKLYRLMQQGSASLRVEVCKFRKLSCYVLRF